MSVEQASCTNGEVRLVGGSGPHEGRVEVCVNEAWGTICSGGWNNADSNVVCKQTGNVPLGLLHIRKSKMIMYIIIYVLGGRYKSFGPGTGPILLSNVGCTGKELSLLECRQQSCGAISCSHSIDVGVVCQSKIIT